MNPIQPPIRPGDVGEPVNGLRAALLYLLDKGAAEAFGPPGQHSPEELQAWAQRIQAEQAGGKVYGGDTQAAVLRLQLQAGLGDGLQGLVDSGTAKAINKWLQKLGAFDGPATDRAVQGRLTTPSGRPAAGFKVVAVDRDLFGEQALGDAVSDADGRYRIGYRLADALAGEGLPVVAADLEVRVLPANTVEPLAVSPVKFNAGELETIDLVVPVSDAGPIEFDEVRRRVQPMLGERAADELTDSHVDFIVGDTGLEPEAVQAWIAGARLRADALRLLGKEGDPKHRAALLDQDAAWTLGHAWHRLGWAGSLTGLLAASLDQWNAALDAGAVRLWIAPLDAEHRAALMAVLAYLQFIGHADPEFGTDPLAAALAPYSVPLPRELSAKALSHFRSQGEAGLEDLPGLAGDDASLRLGLTRLARAIRLHALAEGNTSLIEPLMQKLDGSGTGLQSLVALAAEDWRAVVDSALPATTETSMLAYRMQATVEQGVPGQALLTRLDQGTIDLGAADTGAFNASVAANLKTVDLLMRGGTVAGGDSFTAAYPKQVDKIARIGQYGKAGIAVADGARFVESGRTLGNWITNYGPQGPTGPMGPGLHPMIAKNLDSIRLLFKGGLENLLDPNFGVTGRVTTARMDNTRPEIPAPPTQLPGITSPTMRGMFGDLDDCVCRPCESVTGPAAYLVELLRALQHDVGFQGDGGLPVLRARRPDILDLELSCDNADVLLPHIDLALEQLEWLVAQPQLAIDAPAGRDAASLLTPGVDPLVAALLQKTTQRPLAAPLQAFEKLRQRSDETVWLLRDADGQLSWLVEGLAPGSAGHGGPNWRLRVLGMAVRRTRPLPDPRVEAVERNPEAYRLLAEPTAVFPWSLPFVAARHERDAWLDSLQLDPLQLGPLLPAYEAMPPTSASLSTLDQDTLALSAAEAAIVTTPATGDAVWRAWGFPGGSAIPSIDDPASGESRLNEPPSSLLQHASFLLARSGLNLDELEAVLGTGFVGGYRLSQRDQCKTSLMLAQRGTEPNVQGIDAAALDRLHRLVRLWRRLPAWPLATLDHALAQMQAMVPALGPRIDIDHLRLLAAMERACRAWSLPAADVVGLRIPVLAGAGTALWTQRHAGLAAAIGRPTADLLELLAWQGYAGDGLGTPGDPLDVALRSIGASTTDPPELRLSRMLAAVADAIGRLTALPRWSNLVAGLDMPLPTLMAALVPALQARQSSAPRPPGAQTTAALRDALLGLRGRLAQVPEPAAPLGGKQLEAALVSELEALSWTPEQIKSLRTAFAQPPQTGFDSALLEALTRIPYRLGDTGSPQALLTEAELAALAKSTISAEQRHAFLLDRLIERLGLRERAIGARLTPILGEAAASALLRRLQSPDIKLRQQAAEGLAAPAGAGRALGSFMPLLTTREAQRLAAPDFLDSWRQRLDFLDARLAEREREQIVLGAVIGWSASRGQAGWPAGTAARFLTDGLTIEPASSAANAAPRRAIDRLLSVTFHRSTASQPPAELSTWLERLDTVLTLRAHSAAATALTGMPGLDWRVLLSPPSAERRGDLLLWLALADASRLGQDTLARLLDPSSPRELQLAALAERLGVDAAQAEALALRAARSSATAIAASDLRTPQTVARLFDLAEAARRLKASAAELDAVVGADPAAAAAVAKLLMRRLVGERDWPRQLRRLNDTSRRRRRDALVSYLVQNLPGVRDADQLFERALIDPQTESCLETTRLKQATLAVQMLIQRILEGLEPGAQATDKLRHQWSWMRSYRLWEANRKVFLYPENWLLPELRDDKSPEFRALESRIAQEELTPQRAEHTFGQFLEDLNRAAQTQVLGMFEDVDVLPNPAGDRPMKRDLFLVGRTPNPPYVHYWRQCKDFGKRWMQWSPWERVDADIQGDHVVPFMSNGAMYLAWPKIQDREVKGEPSWQVELAWSRFDGAGWSKGGLSRGEAPTVEKVPLEDTRSAMALRARVQRTGSPQVLLYLKSVAPGSSNRIEPIDDLRSSKLVANEELLSLNGIPKVAELLAGVFDSLGSDEQDAVEFYLHCTHKPPTLGYRDKWFTQGLQLWTPANLDWHRLHRGDETEKPVRSVVMVRRKEPAYLRGFLESYRAQNHYIGFAYAGSPTPQSPYREFVDKILAQCSAVQFSYRAWADLATGALQLHGTEASSFLLGHAALDTDPLPLLPERSSDVFIRPGATAGGQATLTLRDSAGRSPPTVSRSTPEVRAGESLVLVLKFAVKEGGGFTFQRPAKARDFFPAMQFTWSPTGVVTSALTQERTALELIDQNSSAWMGGFKETNEARVNGGSQSVPPAFPLSLPRAWQTPLPLFDPASKSDQQYEVLAAAVAGASALNHSGVWHVKEGNANCFVDTNRGPDSELDNAKTLLYPTAWLRGDALLLNWYRTARLPSWSEQFDDFGVGELPRLGTGAVPVTSLTKDPGIVGGRGSFDNRMPNAGYWWEICLHAPLAIADQLTRQHRFDEADRWLRFIFDPEANTAVDPQAFLRFRRFRELPRATGARTDLNALAKEAASKGASPSPERVRISIERWRNQPFRPFVVARRRHIAFLWRTFFAYIENRIAKADSLYRRETREDIQSALREYVHVARLLGPRPRRTRPSSLRAAHSFADYMDTWDDFANRWLRELPPFQGPSAKTVDAEDNEAPIEGMLYFCIPPNDRVVQYWDTVADRLSNIRHCRSIDGVPRALPIEAPEIDLEALIRSVASGGSVDQFVADSFAPPWPYRYATLLAQAKELISEARNLGAQLLGALEKQDSEQLALLRSTQERALLDRVTGVRKQQIEEARLQLESLQSSRDAIAARYEQLQHQLGNENARAPGPNETAGAESRLGRLSTGNQHAQSNLGLITQEADQLEQLHYAGWWTDADSVARLIAWGFNTLSAGASFASVFEQPIPPGGGSTPSEKASKALGALGSAAASTADGFRAIAQIHQTQASRLAQTAGNIRRRDEWAYQSNQALRELATADKQILASAARLEISETELANHELQREHAAATDDYLRDKFTSAALYRWQSSQLLTLYRQTYGLALALARRARNAAEREIARPLPRISDHWSGQRSGLLAAEQLQHEVRRLELSVLEQNMPELQVTRHVSLRSLNPTALLDLVTAGQAEFELPEWLFDLDAPGHYYRRLKSVAVSVPCVTGPYAALNAKLTLLRSDVRVEARAGSGYARADQDDPRFETRFHAAESVFLSTGREDSGLSDDSQREDRYLPFERAGAMSSWRLEFASKEPQFDRTTISDVVLHLRYTARDGGELLAEAAQAALLQRWKSPAGSQAVVLSLRTEFPAEWAQASQTEAASLRLTLDVRPLLPYWMQAAGFGRQVDPASLQVVAHRRPDTSVTASFEPIASAQMQANVLTIPVASGWRGLADLLVRLQVSP